MTATDERLGEENGVVYYLEDAVEPTEVIEANCHIRQALQHVQ